MPGFSGGMKLVPLALDAMAEGAGGGMEHQTAWLYLQVKECRGAATAPWASWGLSSSPRSTASSSSVGDIWVLSSTGLSSEASTIMSPSRCIRGSIHLWRSCSALHRVREVFLTSLHCVTQKPEIPCTWEISVGRKSQWPNLQMLCGASHNPDASSWAARRPQPTVKGVVELGCHWAHLWILHRVL